MPKFNPTSQQLFDQLLKSAEGDNPDLPWNTYPCIEWPRALSTTGYGQGQFVGIGRRDVHRMAFIIICGHPGPLCVLHHCDNRKCFRPSHLFKGTKKDNTQDMLAKGRLIRRFTADDVRAIREMVAAGQSYRLIGRTIGAPHITVSRIARGLSWAHLK